MDAADHFAPDYAAARDRFRAAARRAGGRMSVRPFAGRGPGGEELTLDAATFGPDRPRATVILSSGLHGVEGFAGSAVQSAWLAGAGPRSLPAGVRVVLAHALNPYGFAHRRRWDADGVDPNRNFPPAGRPAENAAGAEARREARAAYDRLDGFLNPPAAPSRWEPYALKAAAHVLRAGRAARARLPPADRPTPTPAALARLGLAELRKTLPVGQTHRPGGLFYGGTEPGEPVRAVLDLLPRWSAGADLTLHLDVHTGLGRRGELKLLSVDPVGSDRAGWLAERFGQDGSGAPLVEAMDGRTAYDARGTLPAAFAAGLPGTYHGLTAEAGTYGGVRVLGALRAENAAHRFADPASPAFARAKRQVVEAFCPASRRWRRRTVAACLAATDRAVAVAALPG